MFDDATYKWLLIVVTVMWAANIVAGMFRFNGWQPDQSINGIFAAIVVGSFAVRHQAAKGQQDERDESPKGGEHRR